MTIQVRPEELRNYAENINASANKIDHAVNQTYSIVIQVVAGQILRGRRVDDLIHRFRQYHGQMEQWQGELKAFATLLEHIATAFEQADKNNSFQAPADADIAATKEPHPNLAKDGNVPLYHFDFRNMSPDEITKLIRSMELDGRPVVFNIHGFGGQKSSEGDYANTADWYNQKYGHIEPESQRPVVIGITWDADDNSIDWDMPSDYNTANLNAEEAGQKFGYMLNAMNRFQKESNVNVVAHSLGNKVVAEAVALGGDAGIDNYVAVQPAVDKVAYDKDSGRYKDVLSKDEISNMAVVHNDQDRALAGHNVVRGQEALGNNADGFQRPYVSYDLEDLGFTNNNIFSGESNHFSFGDEIVLENVVSDYFGEDGSGFIR